MSSEAITRNDLREILSQTVGSIPSEYKKLLWTNSQGAQTSYSFTADFSKFDELEVVFNRNGGLYTFTCGTSGSASFVFPYNDYLVQRTATISGDTFTFGNGSAYTSYNTGGSGLVSASYAVPSKVYGIKYERVQPPALVITEGEWVQVGSANANGNYTIWENISDYKYIAWYLIELTYGAVEGYFYTPVSVFVQYNTTLKAMGINAYNGGRQYGYLNYVNDTTVNVQVSSNHAIAIWLIG